MLISLEVRRILRDLARGDYQRTPHASLRMKERNIHRGDIRSCAENSFSIEEQPNGRFKIEGFDSKGEPIQVVALWDGETVVITVMGD